MADNYKLIGKGIVAEDKNEGSKFISVYLPESLPYYEGELTDRPAKIKRTILTANGEKEDLTLFKKATVKAEWKKENNQPLAPRVKKGEFVDIYELIDTNLYYWQVSGDSTFTRRNDRILKVFSGNGGSTETDSPQTKENTYGFELDPSTGIVRLWTSAANGEKSTFDIDLNGKAGIISIKAGDLTIQLDKPNDSFLVENSKHTSVFGKGELLELHSKTVKIYADVTEVENDLNVKGKVNCKEINAPKGKILNLGYHSGTHNR